MRNVISQALIYCAVLLTLSLGFVVGRYCSPATEIEMRCDTIVRIDTIRLTEFREVERRVVDTMVVRVPISADSADSANSAYKDSAEKLCSTIVVQNDSLAIALPREEVVIRDSLFTAQISGYKPQLDWIQLTTPTTTIERTTSEIRRQSRWSIGATSGLGVVVNERGLHTGVGVIVGVSYRF